MSRKLLVVDRQFIYYTHRVTNAKMQPHFLTALLEFWLELDSDI